MTNRLGIGSSLLARADFEQRVANLNSDELLKDIAYAVESQGHHIQALIELEEKRRNIEVLHEQRIEKLETFAAQQEAREAIHRKGLGQFWLGALQQGVAGVIGFLLIGAIGLGGAFVYYAQQMPAQQQGP